jgi:hypothetical protein
MTPDTWRYPSELRSALVGFGLAPVASTPPLLVREALNDLYRYELRRMRDRFLAGGIAKGDYNNLVIVLRKKYWPLTLTPDAWQRLCAGRDEETSAHQ